MPLTSHPAETRVVLDNVSWKTFEALLEETGPRRGRPAYEEGTLEIVAPSFEHEEHDRSGPRVQGMGAGEAREEG